MSEASHQSADKAPDFQNGDGFRLETLRFVHQVESLSISFPKIIAFANDIRNQLSKEFFEFLEANAKKIIEDGSKKTFTLEGKAVSQSAKLQRALSSANRTYTLLYRGFLTSLISQYDSFLGRMIEQILLVKPEILNGSDRQLTFGEISQFGSLEEARRFLVEKEVESVVRKSHADQFAWLERTLGMPLRDGLEIWPTFIEITERRNLFVHCDGVISSQYIAVCNQHKVPLDKKIKAGTQLSISNKYLHTACDCIFEIGVKLAQVIWRKLLPNNLQNADLTLNEVCYELLLRQENAIGCRLLDFACCVLKKHSTEQSLRFFILNRAQAYKWSGNEAECKRIIAAEDWSACNETIQIAVAVLSDDHARAASLMRHLKADSHFPDAYKEWPIFRRFRESTDFLKAYEDVYGTSFTIQQVTQTDSKGELLQPSSQDKENPDG